MQYFSYFVKQVKQYALFYLSIPLFSFFAFSMLLQHTNQHFSLLAQAFMHGKLYFLEINKTTLYDAVLHHGHAYWPLGPFPAIILIPFIKLFQYLHMQFTDATMAFFLFLGTFILIIKIARRLGFSPQDAAYAGYAFCFGSVMIGVATFAYSWQYAQIVTVFLLYLAIFLFISHKHPFFLGIILGCVLLTRTTASLGIIFFILMYATEKHPLQKKLQHIFWLVVPVVLCGILLMLYNFARFDNPLEQGYLLQTLYNPSLAAARKYGIFSLRHLPGNLYYFFVAAPQPLFQDKLSHVLRRPFIAHDNWGLSIFITSPYIVYLWILSYKDRMTRYLWITVLIIATPIFFYYGIGYSQFGYRYSLDFLPFLFVLLLKAMHQQFGHFPNRFRLLVIFAGIFNFYLLSLF